MAAADDVDDAGDAFGVCTYLLFIADDLFNHWRHTKRIDTNHHMSLCVFSSLAAGRSRSLSLRHRAILVFYLLALSLVCLGFQCCCLVVDYYVVFHMCVVFYGLYMI